MNNVQRKTKKVLVVFIILIMLINMMPNFRILNEVRAVEINDLMNQKQNLGIEEQEEEEFKGIIMRLDTTKGENGLWRDAYGDYDIISLKILAKNIDITNLIFPIKFDTTKLTPGYSLVRRGKEYINDARDAADFASDMNTDLPKTFNVNNSPSDTDWYKAKDGKIVLNYKDSFYSTLHFEEEELIGTIHFIVDASITDITQINSSIINLDTTSEKFKIYHLEENKSYTDTNKNFSLEGITIVPTVDKFVIKNNPTDGKTYIHGDNIDLTNLELALEYTDGYIENIDIDKVKITSGKEEGIIADVNNPYLTFEYEGITKTIDIKVIDVVDKIAVVGYDKSNSDYVPLEDILKYKDRIIINDSIPKEDLRLKVTTKNGKENYLHLEDNRIKVNPNEENPDKRDKINISSGIQEIDIIYDDGIVTKTTRMDVLVNYVPSEISIAISENDEPINKYAVNDKFEKNGSIDVFKISNGELIGTIPMSSDSVTVTDNGGEVDLTTAGTKTLTVNYAGKTIEYDIRIVNKVKSLVVNIDNAKTKYNAIEVEPKDDLEESDFNGVIAIEKMADGTQGDTIEFGEGKETFNLIDTTAFKNELGKQILKISQTYSDASGEEYTVFGEIPVRVRNQLQGIRIENLRTEYVYKEAIDYTGAKIYIRYMDGEIGPLNLNTVRVTHNFDNTDMNPQQVVFRYSDGVDTVISDPFTFTVTKATLEAPECDTLKVMEGQPLSEIDLSAFETEYGTVIWKEPNTTLAYDKNKQIVEMDAIYKMKDQDHYNDIPFKIKIKVLSKNAISFIIDPNSKTKYVEGQTIKKGDIAIIATYEDEEGITTARLTAGFKIEGADGVLTLNEGEDITEKTLKITYKNFPSENLLITIEPDALEGIELVTEDAKIIHKYGEELDLSNVYINKIMKSEIPQELIPVKDNDDVQVEGYDKTNILSEKQTITITYEGKQASYEVKVIDYILKVELDNTEKAKLQEKYNYGDPINVENINALPEDSEDEKKVNLYVYMASLAENVKTYREEAIEVEMIKKASTKTLGKQIAEIWYNGQYEDKYEKEEKLVAEYDIEVKDWVREIEIVKEPKKIIYLLNEELDLTGLVVRDVMASEETLTPEDTTLKENDYTVDGIDTSTEGLRTVTVTRTVDNKDFTTEFVVIVKDPTKSLDIDIKDKPSEPSKFGQDINLVGGSVIVKNKDNNEGKIIKLTDPGITIVGYNSRQLGRQEVTVIYEYEEIEKVEITPEEPADIETPEENEPENTEGNEPENSQEENEPENTEENEPEVTIIEKLVPKKLVLQRYPIVVKDYSIEDLKLTIPPKKLSYIYGEKLDLTGGEVARVMASGRVFANAKLTDPEVTVEGYNPTKVGTQTLNVTYRIEYDENDIYEGKTTFDVTVSDNIRSIEMEKHPTKLQYKYGEDLDITGATIKVTKDSGPFTIPVTMEMVSGYDKNKVGTQTITVTYEGFTTTFDVTVLAKQSEKVKKGPKYTIDIIVSEPIEVEVGGKIDLSKVKLLVLDEKENIVKEVVVTEQMISGFDNTKEGTQEITVKYIDENGKTYTGTFEVTVKKPVKTLGEKEEVKKDDKKENKKDLTIISSAAGLAVTGALLGLILLMTRKNVEIYEVSEKGKSLIGKQRISKKDRIVLLDSYVNQMKENNHIELVIDSKDVEKLGNEPIKVVESRTTQEYPISENIIVK